MIRFISDPEHGVFTAEASGSLVEIISEIGLCVNTAYNLIRSRNPAAGQAFKDAMQFSNRPDSPVWDKEDVPGPRNGVKIVRVKDMSKEVPHE